ncbi:zinc ABC transporter substrate-binding protein [Anaplasmataceae bacterium AB001_6]|nr:zinc ABC transporter substrate-binding protein [Anaplasmataceae bacterium AB001_6]
MKIPKNIFLLIAITTVVVAIFLSIFIWIFSSNKWFFTDQSDRDSKYKILTTNKPFYFIARYIIHGSEKTELSSDLDYLYKSNEIDSHFIQVKPSDLKLINDSDLIIFSSSEIDAKFYDIFVNSKAELLDLSQYVYLQNIYNSDNSLNNAIDSHFWIIPKNGIKIANALKDKLSAIYPYKAKIYKKNYKNFKKKLIEQNDDIRDFWSKKGDIKYAIYHDSLRYFTDNFNISSPLFIFIDNNHNLLSTRDFIKLFQHIKNKDIQCVFNDQGQDIVDILNLKSADVKIVDNDIFGVILSDDNNDGYFNLIDNINNNFKECAMISKNK